MKMDSFLKKSSLCMAGFAMLVATCSTTSVLGGEPEKGFVGQHDGINFAPVMGEREFSGQMIVRPLQFDAWKTHGLTDRDARNRIADARAMMVNYTVVEHVLQTDDYIIKVPAGRTENDVAQALLATGNFQYADPDWVLYPIACPDDTFFDGYQWQHVVMESCLAWDIETGGPSVSVGICDTGLRLTHEDFQLNRLEGYNAVDRVWESSGGDVSDVHPHGTQTTGCAAANGNNAKGVAGVGWNLSHRMMRVSNLATGGSNQSTLQHAARTSIESGDNVASVSYTGADSSSNLTTATYIKSIGGLLFWAAGNDGRNLTFGNRDNDDLIVVGATDVNDALASFSAYGQFVDVVAPGVDVVTASSSSDTNYVYTSGTSFSCPLAAGMAALIWSANPSLTPDEVEDIIKQGADDIGSAGVDNTFGYGRINSNSSLLLAGGGSSNTPPVAVLGATPTSGTIPLNVNFDASSSFDADGTIVNYEWDWDGDGTYDASTGINPLASYTYTIANVYNATVRVTDDLGATDTDSVTITATSSGGGTPGQVAFDGFESGTFSGGTGSWVGSWFGSGTTLRWNADGPNTGSGHVRMRRADWMERTVDMTGTTDASLTFWAKTRSFESSDQANVWVSDDGGSNYTLVVTFVDGTDDDVYREYQVDLSGFNMTSNFSVLFDGDMSAGGDYWFVDDIDISGTQ